MSYEIGEWVPLEECGRLPAISGIYIIRNIANGKQYVGQSIDIRKRVKSHIQCASSSYLHRALAKHGIALFEAKVAIVVEAELLSSEEIQLIRELGTMSPLGYNLTEGGEGTLGRLHSEGTKAKIGAKSLGRRHTEESRAKLSASHTGKVYNEEVRKRNSVGHKGLTLSEKTKAKIAKSLQGRKASAETIAKLVVARANISAETRAKQSASRKGRRHSEETIAKMRAVRSALVSELNKVVLVWEPECTVPRVFLRSAEAATYLGVPRSTVNRWCRSSPPIASRLAISYG